MNQTPSTTPSIEHLLLVDGISPKAILAEHFTQESPPINLTTVPRTDLDEYLGHTVTLPTPIQKYIHGTDGQLTRNELNNIEIALEKHHRITSPHYITTAIGADLAHPHFILWSENAFTS